MMWYDPTITFPPLSMHPLFPLLGLAHIVAVFAFGIGILFLVAYALRTCTPSELKYWGMWMLGGSIVFALIMSLVMTTLQTGSPRCRGMKDCGAFMHDEDVFFDDGGLFR